MEQIFPLISTRQVGPLGVCHLPRLWLKILLHPKGLLPEGYRHGAGGFDEMTFSDLGIDGEAFVRFVESEQPTYLACEDWVRKHATKLDAASIAAHNEKLLAFDMKPEIATDRRANIGKDAPDTRNAVVLNDLDDWASVHRQVTTGERAGAGV